MSLDCEVIMVARSLTKQFCDAARRLPGSAVSLYPASISDARFLYDWRVDQGFAPASYSDHLAWLNAFLDDPARLRLIGAVGGRPVGMLTMQDEADGSLAISIGLLSREIDQPYGTEMLKLASEKMRGYPLSAAVWAREFRQATGIGAGIGIESEKPDTGARTKQASG